MTHGTKYLELAHNAVSVAAKHLLNRSYESLTSHAKGERDYVTNIDLEVERAVKEMLNETTPDVPFLGEEYGGVNPSHGLCWVLDPVDGTINFMRGNPLCAVSLALLDGGVPIIGIIDFPFLRERFEARRGAGVTLNGNPIRVSVTDRIDQAVVAVGDFAVGEGTAFRVQQAQAIMNQFSGRALRIRMLGSAAADLAWLAAGRIDISLTLSNKPWDVQAGVLLVEEAGGCVFDVNGSAHSLSSEFTLAANESLKAGVVEAVTLGYAT